ncbi:hypothetical protein RFI_38000 [Reticulomyxa filosa]|uniref:Uncharacterized protein n=1 Tax=Reticulomyxa filosa TaxID=46433 RepID=X6LFH0_RETFI|nr:hypothetical protein RFI_38000 [Reticulomyxa filosa]|eukprot:ETN99474.1 hypothetical protein RFI_38000 [Reticulomyxa filosa]
MYFLFFFSSIDDICLIHFFNKFLLFISIAKSCYFLKNIDAKHLWWNILKMLKKYWQISWYDTFTIFKNFQKSKNIKF